MVSQAVRNGTLVGLKYRRGVSEPRFPKLLVELIAEHARKSADGRARCRPDELIAWREKLHCQVKELNKIGVVGTPIYFRTGPYKAKELGSN
jgi:hypothetical protein